MLINCVIFTYLNKYYNYYFIEYLGINTLKHYHCNAFRNYNNVNYYDYYCSNKQLHFQQKILENSFNKISNNFNIKNHFKYTQLWIINNYKKLPNTSLIIIKCLV